jgi:SAM-dependent methyltransferase
MQTNAPPTEPQLPDDDGIAAVSSIAYGFMGSQALFAALDLGLFTALAAGPLGPSELARKLGAQLEPLGSLLAACLALGLIEREAESYRNTLAAQRYLVQHSRGYMGEYYLQQIAETLYAQMPKTRAALRGQTQTGSYNQFLSDPARTELFIRGQHAGSSGPAYLLAKTFDLSAFRCLLDLGGGSGAFSIEAVRRYKTLSAIVFDLPQVTCFAEKFIAEAGLGDRIRCVSGDVVKDQWPKGADLILLSYVISSYRPPVVRDLLARVHGHLPPGGRLIVHDFALHGDRPGPRNAALWSFANLAISTTTHPYTTAEMMSAMTESGFTDVTVRPHVPGITFVFTGRRS